METKISFSDKELASLLNSFFDEYGEDIDRTESGKVLKHRLSALGRWRNFTRGKSHPEYKEKDNPPETEDWSNAYLNEAEEEEKRKMAAEPFVPPENF